MKFRAYFNRLFPIFLIMVLVACNKKVPEPENNNKMYQFSDNFLWGAATSSYQIEGGIVNDWSTSGIDAGKASDHFNNYRKDFQIAGELNTNSYRFSIEWARIEPEKGNFSDEAVNFYKNILKELRKNNLEPMLTLHHFTNPVWVKEQGGWENEKTIQDFLEYVDFIVNEFKDDVDIWITINEPNVLAFKSFDAGEWPPFKKDRKTALKVMRNLLIAHAKSYHLIHKIDSAAKVGFAQHIALLYPNWSINPVDQLMAYFQNKVFNQSYWQSIISGELNISIPGLEIKEPFNQKLKDTMDFIGVNYYTRWMVTSSGKQITKTGVPVTDLDWEIYPQGILETLRMADKYAKKLDIPIYITENGLDDRKDTKRAEYIVSHLKKVWEAQQEGINVKAYMYWSLIDNFEWAEGFEPEFGLMNKERKLRESAKIYAEIAKDNAINKKLANKYLD